MSRDKDNNFTDTNADSQDNSLDNVEQADNTINNDVSQESKNLRNDTVSNAYNGSSDNQSLNCREQDDKQTDNSSYVPDGDGTGIIESNKTQLVADKRWRVITDKVVTWVMFSVIIAMILMLVVRFFLVAQVQVVQSSMYPTYKEGERLSVWKTKDIERSNVVVFYEQENSKDKLILKRVVAVEGDKIWVEQQSNGDYRLFIQPQDSNKVLSEDYYTRGDIAVEIPDMSYDTLGILQDNIGKQNALAIEQGKFFALGDNRPVSKDSRDDFYGQISVERLLGVVIER